MLDGGKSSPPDIGPKASPDLPPREDPTKGLLARTERAPLPVILRLLPPEGPLVTVRLEEGSAVLGAGSGADVVVADPTVSRRHATVTVVPEGLAVRDLDSRNGTFFLGQRVHEVTLSLGTGFRIGQTEVTIELDQQALRLDEQGRTEYGDLVAQAPPMRALFAKLSRLEGSLVNVLIEGESGTGKELIARAIHQNSAVSAGPMIAINCGALPRELVASELFGHRKGAFTGAIESRVGAFQAAHGGTIFLDEIGELALDLQPMLLRALEQRTVTPVGENVPRSVRVRVIAATNRQLDELVRAKLFREDLYYRLMVVHLPVPPLRERPEDVALLARLFARSHGGAELPQIILEQLERHSWPGNVRELRHAVESYLAIGSLPFRRAASSQRLDDVMIPFVDPTLPYHEMKTLVLDAFTRTYCSLLLARTGGNVSQAARVSGLERSYLNKLILRLGVKP